jgi:hypothetical protein
MSCNCNKIDCGCHSTPKIYPVKNTTQLGDSFCKDKCGKCGLDENVMSGNLGYLGIMKEGSETRFTTIPLSALNFLGRELEHDTHNPTYEDRLTYVGGIIEERKSVISMFDGKKSLVSTYYQLEHTIIPTPTVGGWTVEIRKREILPEADVRCVDNVLKIASSCPEKFLSDETELYNIRTDGIDGKLIIKGTLPLDIFDDFCRVIDKLVHYSKAKDGFGEELEVSDLFKCDGTLNTDKYLLGETYATDDCKIGTVINKEAILGLTDIKILNKTALSLEDKNSIQIINGKDRYFVNNKSESVFLNPTLAFAESGPFAEYQLASLPNFPQRETTAPLIVVLSQAQTIKVDLKTTVTHGEGATNYETLLEYVELDGNNNPILPIKIKNFGNNNFTHAGPGDLPTHNTTTIDLPAGRYLFKYTIRLLSGNAISVGDQSYIIVTYIRY